MGGFSSALHHSHELQQCTLSEQTSSRGARIPASFGDTPHAADTTFVNMFLREIDAINELRGAGAILVLPGSEPLLLRPSNHSSGVTTYVVARAELQANPDNRTWWERNNGIVLNCGGAAVSWAGVALAGAAEVPTVGASTPALVIAWSSAIATTAQCGLAVGKESDEDFAEYIQSPDGEWINYADLLLDIVSLAGGVKGAYTAVKTGGEALKASKYAKTLDAMPKGKLLKSLSKLERLEKLSYFRNALKELVKANKVAGHPAGKEITSNMIKRMLPLAIKSLRQESLANLASAVGAGLATASSYYGGAGSKGWGLVKVIIEIVQEAF